MSDGVARKRTFAADFCRGKWQIRGYAALRVDREKSEGILSRRRHGSARYRGIWRSQPGAKTKILRLSEDLPVVIEIVDVLEKIVQFIPIIDSAIERD